MKQKTQQTFDETGVQLLFLVMFYSSDFLPDYVSGWEKLTDQKMKQTMLKAYLHIIGAGCTKKLLDCFLGED